ncbi:DegT/DnrJ/EryC1/StrS aminotransferase family protein [Acinetobacter baumannii]|nr:DegT/DnrJ/EryC1/StrS aminotransferase family protein [Acinetobacter baumannii]
MIIKLDIPEKHFDDLSAIVIPDVNKLIHNKLSGTSSFIDSYEEKLSHWFNVNNAVALSSGSSAILMALYALGINENDNVIVSALAPIPTLLPILQLGAKIIFVDTKKDSFEFDIADLSYAFEKFSPKCMISVPVWGYPVLTQLVIDLAKDNNVEIIEDSAHAHGTIENGRFSGTIGSIGCFSTHENKILSTGEGGFILTENNEIAGKIRSYSRLGGCDGSKVGFNYKISGMQALIGSYRIDSLKNNLSLRNKNAESILSVIRANCTEVQEIPYPLDSAPNYYCLGVLFNDTSEDIFDVIELSNSLGMHSNTVKYKIKPTYEYPIFNKYYRDCPNAKVLSRRITSIPTHPSLASEHLDHFYNIISSYWK